MNAAVPLPRHPAPSLSLVVAVAALCGCPPVDDDHDHTADHAFEVRFAARVGGEDIACGQTFPGVGTTASDIELHDLKLFISDVRIDDEEGAEQALTIDDEPPYLGSGVALLDFEDGTAGCDNGSTTTNTVVRALGDLVEAPTALRFTLGVPFALNHGDAAAADPPLNETSMFWSWNLGYKFLSFDVATTGQPQGWSSHIGSTDCVSDAGGAVTSCDAPNTVEVELDGFNPHDNLVVVDLSTLLSTSNVDENTAGTAPGCMSSADDPECGPVFEKLGLPFGAAPAGAQSVFTFE